LNQQDINYLRRSATRNDIEAIKKNLPTKKSLMDSLLNPTLLKIFHDLEREGTLPNSF
jgi:hypothetical protein